MESISGAARRVHIYQHGAPQIDNDDAVEEFAYQHYTLHGAEDAPPLKWFECQPVVSKKIVMMHIQPESESCASVLWSGNTWNFRSSLDEAGVRGTCVHDACVRARGEPASKLVQRRLHGGRRAEPPTKTRSANISGSSRAST